MRYKLAVCDDSQDDRDYITALCEQWALETGHSVQVTKFSSAENFLFQYEEEKAFDILLLDIEMGAMDGVTLAKKLRGTNETVQIIFITGYSDYISEGYEVAALHYLMKPVKKDKFFAVLDRAVMKLSKNERLLHLKIGSEMVRIPYYQIRYIDVLQNYVTVHAREDYTVKMTLGELSKELEQDTRFCRVGRSAIVNLHVISRVTRKDIILQDKTVLPLPRGAYEGINRAIINME